MPKELIAQYPIQKRDESKLLYYKRDIDKITHHRFCDISNVLSSNDVLVLNNTKVIPARFYVKTEQNKEVEILLVSSIGHDNLTWKVLAKPKRNLRPETCELRILSSEITIEAIDPETIKFKSHSDLEMVLTEIGKMPLPPYIKRGSEDIDIDRYQTVFASSPGAVAAPTAALHFTKELLEKIQGNGVEILYITLHVGPGTFLPIRSNDIRGHKLIPEMFYIDPDVWEKIQTSKKNKKRIIACGTTTVRALEYAALIDKCSGQNGLYITPDFKFQIVDGLITNFHLPKTTLLVLVSTLIGWEKTKEIYQEAIKEKYRFYSYGDVMLIVP